MRFNSQLRSIGHESIIGCNFGLRLHLASLDADLDDGSRLELVHKMDLCMRVLKTSTYFWITTNLWVEVSLSLLNRNARASRKILIVINNSIYNYILRIDSKKNTRFRKLKCGNPHEPGRGLMPEE